MASGVDSSVWTHNLKLVGSLSHADITHIGLKCRTQKAAVQKGYTFLLGLIFMMLKVSSVFFCSDRGWRILTDKEAS